MTSDGHVYTWGSAAKSNTTPALVNKGEADSNEDVIDNVWYVSTGLSHLTAFRANSDATKAYIYAWGSNNYGQLGDSSFVNATEPRQVGDREARVIEINNGQDIHRCNSFTCKSNRGTNSNNRSVRNQREILRRL